jgi:hypothetical protein
MTDKLRQGDRVRCEYGRTGVLNGVFAEAVAWVCWDNDLPGYESIENLSKVLRAAERQTASKPARQPSKEYIEERACFPRSRWPRVQVPSVA